MATELRRDGAIIVWRPRSCYSSHPAYCTATSVPAACGRELAARDSFVVVPPTTCVQTFVSVAAVVWVPQRPVSRTRQKVIAMCSMPWNKAKRPGHEDSEADQMYELETERMLAPPRLRKQRPVLVQDSWSSVG